METKKLSELCAEFQSATNTNRIYDFTSNLKKHIKEKVDSAKADVKDKNLLTDFQEMFLFSEEGTKRKGSSVRRQLTRMVSDTNMDGKSRNFVIEVGFALMHDKANEQRPIDFVNDLLLSLGYTQLRSTFEKELFYIYGLNNNITFNECEKLYTDYLNYIKQVKTKDVDVYEDKTSTFFSTEIVKLRIGDTEKGISSEEKEALFKSVSEYSASMKSVSVAIQKEIIGIVKKSNVSLAQYACEFFLAFSSQADEAEDLRQRLLQEYFSQANNLNIKLTGDYSSLFEYVNKNHYGYMKPFVKISYVKTIYDSLSSAINGQKMLSREGCLLLLLFAGYSRTKIDEFISRRYEPLKSKYYFDRFVMIVSSFKMDKKTETIIYTDPFTKVLKQYEIIDAKELNLSSDENFRLSVIKKFNVIFNEAFSATNFVDDSAVDKGRKMSKKTNK